MNFLSLEKPIKGYESDNSLEEGEIRENNPLAEGYDSDEEELERRIRDLKSKKEPVSEFNRDLTTIIHGITFTLLEKSEYNPRYKDVVRIQSYLDDHSNYKFWVYRSNSEMGFWRFCSKETQSDFFYKGRIDYVQSTFIHLELQDFFLTKTLKILYLMF